MASSDDGRPQDYNRLMAYYKNGYAFYDPESSTEMKPGKCGYIDGTGSWHPIVDIAKTAATEKAGYSKIEQADVGKMKHSKRRWGPMHTETVKTDTVSITAGATGLPAGIPAEASAVVEFSLNSDFGAVLLCKGEVLKHYYVHAEPFRKWARKNAEKLLEKFPTDLQRYGLYVVLTTFTCKEVKINGWKDQSHKVALGFKGDVAALADIAATTEFYGAHKANGWIEPICEGDEEKVVFFGGLKYEFRKLTGWMRKPKDKFEEIPQERWRGDNLIIQDPEVEEDAIEINESQFGEVF